MFKVGDILEIVTPIVKPGYTYFNTCDLGRLVRVTEVFTDHIKVDPYSVPSYTAGFRYYLKEHFAPPTTNPVVIAAREYIRSELGII